MRRSWKLGSRLAKRLRNLFFTSVLTTVAGVIIGLLFNPITGVVSVSVVLAHEAGHYYSALVHDADPDIPIVIPLGILTLGITKVNKYHTLSPRIKRYLLWCGPLAGIAATVALVPGALMLPGLGVILTAVAASELLNMTLGSDGVRRRQLQQG